MAQLERRRLPRWFAAGAVVLLAFTVGAELAGVVGALIALPLAAIYPSGERVWLGRQLGDSVVEEDTRDGARVERTQID